jgi:hypothetical protein
MCRVICKNYKAVLNAPSIYGVFRDELDKRESLRMGRDSLPSEGSLFLSLGETMFLKLLYYSPGNLVSCWTARVYSKYSGHIWYSSRH